MDQNYIINDLRENQIENVEETSGDKSLLFEIEIVSQSVEVAEIIELRNRFGITSPGLLAKAMRMPEVKIRKLLKLCDSLFLRVRQ